jgi:hypothetical protein
VLTGRLVIDATSPAELEHLLAGGGEVQITAVDAGVDGELVRHALRPLLVEALTAAASSSPTVERQGPLVRVFINRPTGETT